MTTERARAVWKLAAAALVIAWWTSAGADEGRGALKRITVADADSNCVGNPVTPECALDTWMGCWSHEDQALCDAVGYWQERVSEDHPGRSVEYRVEHVVIIDAKAIAAADPEIAYVLWFRPPVYRFFVTWRWCIDSEIPCRVWFPESASLSDEFYVVRANGGWQLRARLDYWYPEDEIPTEHIIDYGCPYYEAVYEPCN